MAETFIVNVSIHISMNEQMVDVQLHGLVDEQQFQRCCHFLKHSWESFSRSVFRTACDSASVSSSV